MSPDEGGFAFDEPFPPTFGEEVIPEEVSLLDRLFERASEETIRRIAEYLRQNPEQVEEFMENGSQETARLFEYLNENPERVEVVREAIFDVLTQL